MKNLLLCLLIMLFANRARAQSCEEPSKCYDEQTRQQIKEALQELDKIHNSKAELKLLDPVIIVRDWDGRIYVNGGDKKPLRMQLKISDTINRDVALTLSPKVYTREKPADPMLRLRLRAQIGVLARGTYERIASGGNWPVDGGLNLDFFHLGPVNLGVYAGVFSSGVQIGLDLTRNFGVFAGPTFVYQGLKADALMGCYFSFN